MNRYLINIAYIGTRFRGIQKQITLDTSTVQGSLELALSALRPLNPIQTFISSRTDAGVHALQSSIHVDLNRRDGNPYKEQTVTAVLNRTLQKRDLPIRVLSTIHVSNEFHCRYQAKGRTYLYRIAVPKKSALEVENLELKNIIHKSFIPIEEIKRCHFVLDPTFDIEKFREAASLFKGRHDFRTFMSTSKQDNKGPMFSIRTISDIKVYPGKSLAVHVDAERADSLYNYWDIEISGKSFLYKQVRRIVGCLITISTNRINLKDVYEMLTIPSKDTWHNKVVIVPPFGLYLCKVHYDEADFVRTESNSETISPCSNHEPPATTSVEERQAQAN